MQRLTNKNRIKIPQRLCIRPILLETKILKLCLVVTLTDCPNDFTFILSLKKNLTD